MRLVSNFPIDYMHNVCLGVMKKILTVWISGPLQTRLHSRIVCEISFKRFIPQEFNRKPRALCELQRWKATEYRLFLLYVGPIVLFKKLGLAIYENFMLLHAGITILVSKKHLQKLGLKLADKILMTFVNHRSSIYETSFLAYNVHYLSHITDDVANYGVLDNFSCFPFENFLYRLKRLVKSTTNPLTEIYNRLVENKTCTLNFISKETEFTLKHYSDPIISPDHSVSIKSYN